jgi:hypothetical protein
MCRHSMPARIQTVRYAVTPWSGTTAATGSGSSARIPNVTARWTRDVVAAKEEQGRHPTPQPVRRVRSQALGPASSVRSLVAVGNLPSAMAGSAYFWAARPTLPVGTRRIWGEGKRSRPTTGDNGRPCPNHQPSEPDLIHSSHKSIAGVRVVSAPQLFPTPAALARRVVDLADIQPGMTVLEPSAGTVRSFGRSRPALVSSRSNWLRTSPARWSTWPPTFVVATSSR